MANIKFPMFWVLRKLLYQFLVRFDKRMSSSYKKLASKNYVDAPMGRRGGLRTCKKIHSHRTMDPWDWYVYIHKGSILMVDVGKYTIYTMHTWILWDFKMLYLSKVFFSMNLNRKVVELILLFFFNRIQVTAILYPWHPTILPEVSMVFDRYIFGGRKAGDWMSWASRFG